MRSISKLSTAEHLGYSSDHCNLEPEDILGCPDPEPLFYGELLLSRVSAVCAMDSEVSEVGLPGCAVTGRE